MRTIKSVTIANTKGSKDSRFITKNGSPKSFSAIDKIKEPEAKTPFSAALGSRSDLESTQINNNDVMISDRVATEIASIKNEIGAVETAAGSSESFGDGGPGGMSGGLPSGTSVTDIVVRNMIINVIDDVITDNDPYRTNKLMNKIFRDMYQHDATSGSAIDLMSTIPFSDFSITGMKDEKMTQLYVDSVESMSVGSLLPNISVDYMTVGSILLSMAFSDNMKRFTGVTPHNIDYAHFLQVPVFNVDPQITITLPPHFMTSLNNTELMEKYKDYIPQSIIDLANSNTGKKGQGVLDSKTTIFIPRRGMLSDYRGVSILKRALPAWFYEKALIKGTLDQVHKRQRATTHVTMGEGEDWVPTAEEMTAVSNLFLSADLDPLGAVVVTRTGVNVNEIRRGDDFWRWDQNYDQIERIKLRALGVSESFVTGDATYNNMEQSLSVFMDQIRTFRGQITRELFYEKMFPMISEANGITKQRYGVRRAKELSSYGNTRIYRNENHELVAEIGSNYPVVRELAAGNNEKIDISKYLIPEVTWHKRLLPEADNDYLGILNTLEEKGVPINIRALAAAGGQKLDKLMEGMEEDIKIREKIAEYRKQIMDINREAGVGQEGEEGEGGGGSEFANFILANQLGTGSTRRRSILSRGNPDHPSAEFTDYDSQGNRRVLTKQGRSIMANRFNKTVAAAAAEVARQENARNKAEAPEPNKKFYHGK